MLPDWLQDRVTVTPTGCWMAKAKAGTSGYVEVRDRGTRRKLHRLVYERLVGPIPAGLDLDHECHNRDTTCAGGTACRHRACCNPEHCAPKSRSANVHAGVLGRVAPCPHGSDRKRNCGKCTTERVRRFRARQAVAA